MALSEQGKEIDLKKRALELKANSELKSVFNNIADDISNLLLSTKSIQPKEFANNYKSDFTGILRNIYRRNIKIFGFFLRKQMSKKLNIDFNIKKQIYNLENKQENEVEKEEENEVNRLFLLSMLYFINNRSEIQAEKITQTNEKEIEYNINKSVSEYNILLANNLNEQQKIGQRISNIFLSVVLGTSTLKEKDKLEKELRKLEIQKEKLVRNKNKIISKGFKNNFKKRGKTRSKVISEFEVGQSESFIREEEAKTINKVKIFPVNIKKNWESYGDSRVREAHQIADANYHFKPIPLEQNFYVGGEILRYPRDANGSASNIINCRCVSIHKIID